jgi:hypothetical protein
VVPAAGRSTAAACCSGEAASVVATGWSVERDTAGFAATVFFALVPRVCATGAWWRVVLLTPSALAGVGEVATLAAGFVTVAGRSAGAEATAGRCVWACVDAGR